MPEEPTSISNVWAQRSLGIDLSQNLTKATSFDAEYLANHCYPFIQLVNSDAVFSAETKINFIPISENSAEDEPKIHDYGEAISASIAHKSVKKQIELSDKIANLIAQKGWEKVEIIGSTELMKRLIWIESKRFGFELVNHTPSKEDQKHHDLVFEQIKANGLTWKKTAVKEEAEKGEFIIGGAGDGGKEDEEKALASEDLSHTTLQTSEEQTE